MQIKFFPKKTFLVLSVLTGLVYGCTNHKGDTPSPSQPAPTGCDTTNMSFATDINPIIQQSCAISGCHDHDTKANNYDYSTYAGVNSAVQNQRLLGAINHQSGYIAMPQNMAKLTDCEIAKITQWVAIGAPNN